MFYIFVPIIKYNKKTKQNMKKLNFTKINLLAVICLALFSFTANAQEEVRSKNNIHFGGGISIPILTASGSSENFASNGSNFYINYEREMYRAKNGYLTMGVKYINIANPYSQLESDVSEINSTFPESLGVWSGSSDKFKLTSYLVGVNWYEYISKNKKWACYVNVYLGSATLTSPTQTFTSSNGSFLKIKELKSSDFAYSSNVGIIYDLSKSVSIGFNIDYFKSSFSYNNQELSYTGGSDYVPSYKINYTNLNLNSELIFKF